MKIGIIGLPNSGKSTLFQALTKKQVARANYPFTTIEPNVGVVAVPDERLKKLTEILKPQKTIPAIIEFVDIAGLVKGAHQGEGLGNQFLSHIREVDAVCHVVRIFEDPDVAHVHGKIDPKNDIEVIHLELQMADLAVIEKRLAALRPKAKSNDKEIIRQVGILEELKDKLENNKLEQVKETAHSFVSSPRRRGSSNYNDIPALDSRFRGNDRREGGNGSSELNLLIVKPELIVYNIKAEVSLPDRDTVIDAKLESELADLEDQESEKMRQELGIKQSGLSLLIKKAYSLLELIAFYTAQNKILQAWSIPENTPAPKAAGKIHGDFEKGFIKAEVINWQDLISAGNENKAREKGLVRTEGKNYIVRDGDVINFKV